jgi:hypothetical protein
MSNIIYIFDLLKIDKEDNWVIEVLEAEKEALDWLMELSISLNLFSSLAFSVCCLLL